MAAANMDKLNSKKKVKPKKEKLPNEVDQDNSEAPVPKGIKDVDFKKLLGCG